jgi:hypothetical protein
LVSAEVSLAANPAAAEDGGACKTGAPCCAVKVNGAATRVPQINQAAG